MLIRILLADDHTLFRQMLREILSRNGKVYDVVGEAAYGEETLNLVTRYHPALLLLDYKMPGLGRLSAFCKEVGRRSPTTRTLLVSGFAGAEIALEAAIGGARGYILKDAPVDDLLTAIATIHAGGIWVDASLPPQVFHTFLRQRVTRAGKLGKLSRQELNVLSLLAQGMGNREIGFRLHICEKTVKNHLTHIFAKLGVVGRQQAVRHFLPAKKSA